MSKAVLAVLIYSFFITPLFGQYLGAGKGNVDATSSSDYQDPNWPSPANANKSVDGSGLLNEYFQAHRLLQQASIGFEESHVNQVMTMGYSEWIDNQMGMPMTRITPEVETVFQLMQANHPANEDPLRRPSWLDFNYAWWQVNSTNNDLLRHKVATALSEIFVISRNSDVGEYGDGMADYYDMLLQHAFGDYRDLLYDVSLHAMMGHYLSHANNPKSNPEIGQHPDENYAREIMQLFSIGLYELNEDGSRKQANGQDIPTYDNTDIAQLARVFTGLGYYDVLPHLDDPDNMYDDEPFFGMGLWKANVTEPMRMYDVEGPTWREPDMHEDGPKSFLGLTIPTGQSGLEDINDAIDHIAAHDNIAPFIGYRLIQRLVKSNPSPAYIQRVSNAFNSSGRNLGAMVRAILMDEEARDCSYQDSDLNSKLKEPLFRLTQFSRMVEKEQPQGYYWNVNQNFYQDAKQDIFAAPSVFNFFLFDDTPNGPISDQNLVAPEFKIHDSRSSVGYFNSMFRPTRDWGAIMYTWEDWVEEPVRWVIDDLLSLAHDSEVYINWLDQHILGGQMSDHLRKVLRQALNTFSTDIEWHNAQENRVRIGMHLALISADYAVMR